MEARSRGMLAGTLLLACLAALGPRAAASPLLEAELGFGGFTPSGKWVPLRARCEGLPESASIRVLRLAEDDLELGAETFPARDGLRLECPVWTEGELETVAVRLVSGGGLTLAEARLDARRKPFPGHLVLAYGLSPRSRIAIASCLLPSEPVQAIPIAAADLPANGLDYDGISALAIADAGIELAPAQREALLSWVASGGRLLVAEWGAGGGAVSAALPPSGGLGLGRIVRLTSIEEFELSAGPADWRRLLALEPYESEPRTGPGPAARSSEAEGSMGDSQLRAAAVLAAALATWLASTLAAALLAKGRVAPIAALAGLALAAALAGGPALDASFMRGASVRALALALPGSGSAYLTLSARPYAPREPLAWMASRAASALPVAFGGSEEMRGGDWRHALPKASLSLRSSSQGSLELEASLSPAQFAALPGLPRGPAPRGGSAPPELESAGPLAYLSSGAEESWWEKAPGARWARTKGPPGWIAADAAWVLGARGGSLARAVLAGTADAAPLGLRVAGGPVRDLRWAMPLPAGVD